MSLPPSEECQVRFIVNPRAGGAGVAARLGVARRLLSHAGVEATVLHTAAPGHATELARAVRGPSEVVVAVGGDGTIRETATGLAGSEVPMAVMPAGTENLFAKQFGFSARPASLVDTLLNRTECVMDIGMAGDQPFLVIAGIGFDAEVVERVSRMRSGHITRLDYFWPIWRTTWGHGWPHLSVALDDVPFFEGQAMAFVANMPRYAANINPCPDAQWDDGLLDVSIMPCRNPMQLTVHAILTVLRANRGALRAQGRKVTISSPDAPPMQADGDPSGSVPVDFTIRPHALRVLMPCPARRSRTGLLGSFASGTNPRCRKD